MFPGVATNVWTIAAKASRGDKKDKKVSGTNSEMVPCPEWHWNFRNSLVG